MEDCGPLSPKSALLDGLAVRLEALRAEVTGLRRTAGTNRGKSIASARKFSALLAATMQTSTLSAGM